MPISCTHYFGSQPKSYNIKYRRLCLHTLCHFVTCVIHHLHCISHVISLNSVRVSIASITRTRLLSYVNLVWIMSGFSCQSSMLTHIYTS